MRTRAHAKAKKADRRNRPGLLIHLNPALADVLDSVKTRHCEHSREAAAGFLLEQALILELMDPGMLVAITSARFIERIKKGGAN